MRLFGLIGYPLTHSFSRNYFTEKFRKEKIENCAYENFELASISELPRILREHSSLEGLNVTIPYKESVIPFLNQYTEVVRQTGACNCMKIVDGKLFGYNTDVIGFEKSLLSKLPSGQLRALLLGTGGAAKAVAFVLRKLGIECQQVSRRSSADAIGYGDLTPAVIDRHRLIINTTPVGMFPRTGELPPLPYESITPGHFLFDLIYNPEKTMFLKRGEEKGAVIQNGYEMLESQAEESWKIWNGLNI